MTRIWHLAALSMVLAAPARADVLQDWTDVTVQSALLAKQLAFAQGRTVAMVHVAMFEALDCIEPRYASYVKLTPQPADRGASMDAAAATAAHDVLVSLFPEQRAAVDAALDRSLGRVSDASARSAGTALGRRAAAAVLALRTGDGASAAATWRPVTTPGTYLPTALPVGITWGQVKPWVMQSGSQVRPAAPPKLTSTEWARDYEEVRTLGGKASTARSAVQTETARFWEMTGPGAFKEIVASALAAPGRAPVQNARLLALVSLALADSYIAVFDAKYTYAFWRPVTAIRNGDQDGNDATTVEPGWVPLIDTPMHPEYPCAHCINAGALAAVLEREFGAALPPLKNTSTTLPGVVHTWTRAQDVADEVSNARVWSGVHWRTSTVVGMDMGRKIGALVVDTVMRPR